jgi:hypothetical protein
LESDLLETVDDVVALEFVSGCQQVQGNEFITHENPRDWGFFFRLPLSLVVLIFSVKGFLDLRIIRDREQPEKVK